MLEIRLLGQFDLRRDGMTIALPSRSAQSLLAYLALNPGIMHRREQLAGLLAPDDDEISARSTLRHALWRIRKSLGNDPATGRDYLLVDEIAIGFDAAVPCWLDATVVAARLPSDASPTILAGVLALYQGDLLPGFFDEWVGPERERLEAAFESKMRLYLERQAGAGCWDDVLDCGERWVSLGHSPESAYCALMLAHAAQGDGSRVASTYQRCVDDLRTGLGVQPTESTRCLYERLVRSGGVPLFSQAQVLAMPAATAPASATPPLPASPGAPPFKGLQPFDVSDAPLFFGREALTARLIDFLRRRNLLIVVGPSGSGKSSLVRAGLVPAILEGRLFSGLGEAAHDARSWNYQIITPTGHPLHALALAVTGGDSVLPAAALCEDMVADPRSLCLFLTRAVSQGAPRTGGAGHTLLVVDQFEEVFTLCPREEERSAFIANLMAASLPGEGGRDCLLHLVICLRADFYGQCAAYEELRRALETSQQFIGAMDRAELRRCIEGPLQAGGWEIEPGLVDLLVREAGCEPGSLPLLSHALLETWRARSGRLLTLDGYAATGGVRGAIARTAEAVYSQFDEEEQAVARRIFLRLTALGDGMLESRRRVAQAELLTVRTTQPLVDSVLETMAAARLITLGQGQAEVAHEALIREWPRLQRWLAEDREGIRLHHRLTEAVEAWEASQRDAADLYRGVRLVQTLEWAVKHDGELSPAEREFLAQSQAEAERAATEREARQRKELEAAQNLAEAERSRAELREKSNRELRRRALLLAWALAFVLGTSALAMLMWRQAGQSAEAARRGEAAARSRELAASAEASAAVDPERGILLALEAVEVGRQAGVALPAEAEAALHHAVQSSPLDASLVLTGTMLVSMEGGLAAAFDGESLAVWDLPPLRTGGAPSAAPRYVLRAGPEGGAGLFEFSGDGLTLAVARPDGRIGLYDAATGALRRFLPGHAGGARALRLSHDGRRLVSTGADDTVRTWETATGAELVPLSRPSGAPRLIAISPDGTRLLAYQLDGGVYVWDPVAGKNLFYALGHAGRPWSVDFCGSPDRFVVGSGATVRLWVASAKVYLSSVAIPTPNPTALACSPDGLRLAVAGDATAWVWNLETGALRVTLPVGAPVSRLAFAGDGSRLITYHEDGRAQFWDLEGRRELVALGTLHDSSDVAFGADGALLAAGSGDRGVASVWRTPAPGGSLKGAEHGGWQRLYELAGHSNMVDRIAFDRSGHRLATGGLDAIVLVWELPPGGATPSMGRTVFSSLSPPADLTFGNEGAQLAIAAGTTAVLLDLGDLPHGRRLLHSLRDPFSAASPLALAWSPDGAQLAAGMTAGAAVIVDPIADKPLVRLTGYAGAASDIAYSPDGSLLAAAGADGAARIWDARVPGEASSVVSRPPLFTLSGHAAAVTAVAFAPDSTVLATGGEDSAVLLWDAKSGRPLYTLTTLPAPVTGLAFSPDGRYLATSGDAVRIFLVRLDDLAALARLRVSRGLTADECRQFLHTESATCPPAAGE